MGVQPTPDMSCASTSNILQTADNVQHNMSTVLHVYEHVQQ